MPDALSQDEIDSRLNNLSVEWVLTADALEREFRFNDFKSALNFVNKIGEMAEEQNHHPDFKLSWGKVVLSLCSHDAGGITEKDFKLASLIDQEYGLPNET